MEFRQIEREDLPQLREWRNSERIRKACREYRLLNMVNQEEWFERISKEKTNDMFLIVENLDYIGQSAIYDRIGVCGLTYINWKDKHAEISYYSGLTNPIRNIKLATEAYNFLKKKAFEEYNLNRLWGEIYSNNEVALKLALKNGLKEEGRLRQTYWWEGKYWDSIIVAILAEEYFGQQNNLN